MFSDTQHIKCRVCHKHMLNNNYQTHLETVHANEDSNDLREHQQPSIANCFKRQQDDNSEAGI